MKKQKETGISFFSRDFEKRYAGLFLSGFLYNVFDIIRIRISIKTLYVNQPVLNIVILLVILYMRTTILETIVEWDENKNLTNLQKHGNSCREENILWRMKESFGL